MLSKKVMFPENFNTDDQGNYYMPKLRPGHKWEIWEKLVHPIALFFSFYRKKGKYVFFVESLSL